jgi:hypothetical protein
LAAKVSELSLSPDVELAARPAYAKIAESLNSDNAKALYDKLMTFEKAAVIIRTAEAAVAAEAAAAEAEAARLAAIAEAEAEAAAAEIEAMFE